MDIQRLTIFLLFVALAIQGTLSVSSSAFETCRNTNRASLQEEFHIDVFTEILSNHTTEAKKLETAPFIGNMDPNAPAYEFKGSGIHFPDRFLSDSIREYSCSTNEITLFGSVFFKDGNSAGPVIELSYADSFGPTLPVFSLQMDALADEIIVAYRHLGNLHTEVFSARLHNGKWRKYGVTLSGNQALVYDNCHLTHQRVIPLPDYCANDSSLIISVADSAFQDGEQLPGIGMFAFLQNVGVHFGQHGIQKLCPNIPEACASCGRFLKLVQRVYGLNLEVERLKRRVSELEEKDTLCSTQRAECSHTVNNQTSTFANGTFIKFPDQTVCYCNNGRAHCTNSINVCVNDSLVEPPTTPPAPTPTSPEQDTGPILCPESPPIPGLRRNEVFLQSRGDVCIVYTCVEGFIGIVRREELFTCPASGTPCHSNFTAMQQNVAKCCLVCTECSFKTCPNNSSCKLVSNQAVCQCDDGFKMDDQLNTCVDVNECSSANHGCPANSMCENTEGSFECVCNDGYNMVISADDGKITCEDDDECETASCGAAVCKNTPGGYDCVCPDGSITTTESCENFCDPPCQNGATCGQGGMCLCHPGYTGDQCNEDFNECEMGTHNCLHERSLCINTVGGFFCRCEAGYTGNGIDCEDVDECSLNLDNCVNGAECVNFAGSFECLCKRGIEGLVNCTGSCSYTHKKQTIDLKNEESMIVSNCKNCTCLDGDVSCVRVQCNCSTYPPRDCCPQCYREDCEVGSIRIRPGQTWVNPSNRCERIFCNPSGGMLVPVHHDLSKQCPVLDCPANLTIQPMGKCCPICLLQPCTIDNNKQSVRLRNGCETCLCEDSQWTCKQKMNCPIIDCQPEHILFSEDGCCPVCARQAFGEELCESF